MVERIPKVESDVFRVQHKEDASDDKERQRRQEKHEEHDEFAPKLDFKKWTGDKSKPSPAHQSLWNRTPSTSVGEPQGPEVGEAVPTEMAEEPVYYEEQTTSTTITFLRAVGLVNRQGGPQWGTILLYAFALIGLVATVTFVINVLL